MKTSFPSEVNSEPSSAPDIGFTISVPAHRNMELSPTSTIRIATLATFNEPQIEHLPLAHGDSNLLTVDALKQPGSTSQQLPEKVMLLCFYDIRNEPLLELFILSGIYRFLIPSTHENFHLS